AHDNIISFPRYTADRYATPFHKHRLHFRPFSEIKLTCKAERFPINVDISASTCLRYRVSDLFEQAKHAFTFFIFKDSICQSLADDFKNFVKREVTFQ